MKKFILLFLFSFFGILYSQTWTWGIKATGTSQNYNAIDLNVDGDGNMVLAGYYRLNFSLGNFSISSIDDYYRDIYLAKINSNKEVVWLKNIEANHNYGNVIALKTDDDGNIFLTGSADNHYGIVKYDSDGNKLWSNNDTAGATSISFDQEDNIYVAGGSGWSFFIAKLDKMGQTIWKKSNWYNYSDAISISDIEVDRFGNIYFTGYFAIGELKLDDQITLTNTSSKYRWCLFGKMDTNGNFIWAKNFQGTVDEAPKLSLTRQNEIIITGSYRYNLEIENETIEAGYSNKWNESFLSKFNINGNLIWLKNGSLSSIQREGDKIVDSKIDFDGNIYVTGAFYGYNDYYGYSTYVEKYNKDGVPLWRYNNKQSYSKALDIDNFGNLYHTGYNYFENYINPNAYSTLSAGIGQFNTNSSTFNKIKKPVVNGNKLLCINENTLNLSAVGENIQWYSDPELNNLIGSGNSFNLDYINDTKVYVTQTINNIESWARVVYIRKSDLNINNIDLQYNSPRLSVTNNPEYSYQWYYNNILIPNANTYFFDVENGNNYLNYSVMISQENCSIKANSSILSANEALSDMTFIIYPNPSSEYFKIIHSKNSTILSVDIIDLSGKVVKNFRENEKYNIANIPSGKYFARIKSKNNADKILPLLIK